jgi:sugar transferase (PEP-CTERM/EpsH1 system associated)
MARLLFLTQRIPYPPDKGEKIRQFQILQHLRKRYEVHLGCLVDDPHDVQHIDTVKAFCASSHFARLDRARAKIASLRGLLTGEPLSVVFYRDPGLEKWVRRVLDTVKPDLVFVFSSNMAPYVLNLKRTAPLMVDLVDLDSEKWLSYSKTHNFPMRWVYRREGRKIAALEARIAREADWSLFVSEAEAALFQTREPAFGDRVHYVSNGVDLAYFDPAQSFPAPYGTDVANFVFTGAMDYPPNVDAVSWFAREVLPAVRRALPGAQFHIAGSNPTAPVRALANLPGVFVTGRVADIRPYIAHATASVAPMRIARGIQNKVLEAMAMGRPTVVTPDALEGIDAEPGAELLLAQTPEAFAEACIACAAPEARALGEAARRRVVRAYGWPKQLERFDSFLNEPKVAPVL